MIEFSNNFTCLKPRLVGVSTESIAISTNHSIIMHFYKKVKSPSSLFKFSNNNKIF